MVIFMFSLAFAALFIRISISAIFDKPNMHIPKNIKADISKSIHKGCLFDDVKYIFDNKERIDINAIYNINANVYETNVDIIDVLDDMIYDYYQNPSVDTFYINKLYLFKKEAKEKYPFDKLHFSQKNMFDNLRNNAGECYESIENDVLIIANELCDKNDDIDTYLAEAESSYILSIIAFFISLVPFIPPLWKWFKRLFMP